MSNQNGSNPSQTGGLPECLGPAGAIYAAYRKAKNAYYSESETTRLATGICYEYEKLTSEFNRWLTFTGQGSPVDADQALSRAMGETFNPGDPVFRFAIANALKQHNDAMKLQALLAYIEKPISYKALLSDALPESFLDWANRNLEIRAYQGGTYPTSAEDWPTFLSLEEDRPVRALSGLPTGLVGLDSLTGGLNGLTFLVGDTGVGKSAFAAQSMLAAIEGNSKCGAVYFSLDMEKPKIYQRLRCHAAGLTQRQIEGRVLTPEQCEALQKGDEWLAEAVMPKLAIREWTYEQRYNEQSGKQMSLTAEVMATAVRSFRQAAGVSHVLIVVDLLGKMAVGRGKDGEDDLDERRLKVLTELRDRIKGCTMLVLAEVRKDVRGNRLSLDDIRGSVSIPYAADAVWSLEPDNHNRGVAPDGEAPSIIRVLKTREGDRGEVPVTFHYRTYEFSETTTEPVEAVQPLATPNRFVGRRGKKARA